MHCLFCESEVLVAYKHVNSDIGKYFLDTAGVKVSLSMFVLSFSKDAFSFLPSPLLLLGSLFVTSDGHECFSYQNLGKKLHLKLFTELHVLCRHFRAPPAPVSPLFFLFFLKNVCMLLLAETPWLFFPDYKYVARM